MPNSTKQPAQQQSALDVFETSIGWFVVQHIADKIQQIKFGFDCRADAFAAFPESKKRPAKSTTSANWREALVAYSEGRDVSFLKLELETDWMTPFQRSVVAACRSIPRGQTVTYGELAVLANSPGAAQAVGTVMKTNRFPVVIPCHRVVAASGLGGYSAGSGVEAKRRLLDLEGALKHSKDLPLFD